MCGPKVVSQPPITEYNQPRQQNVSDFSNFFQAPGIVQPEQGFQGIPATSVSLWVVNLEASPRGNFVTLSTQDPFLQLGEADYSEYGFNGPHGYLVLQTDYLTWGKLMVGTLVPAQITL